MSNPLGKVVVVGAGLAGSEASYYLANKGVQVILLECKTQKLGPHQKSKNYCELVCTNSLKSINPESGHGLLKQEMEALGSLVLKKAYQFRVPAGDALAVDRELFSKAITEELKNHPNITILETEASDPIETVNQFQADHIILATGPLTTPKLEKWIQNDLSKDDFYFYDAIAPVVDADTIDYSKAYFKDRHKDQEESSDYLNLPLNKEQYEIFVNELIKAEKVPAQNFEDYKFFEACLPVDLMAERGIDTPRFSCMKPIGLETSEHEDLYAVVQLRKENLLGSAFNMVGFQNRLTYKEQVRVFRMLPGLENASFIHLGSVHRNSFLNSAKLLNFDLSSKKFPKVSFAGQITGVEGYTESASMGLYVASQVYQKLLGKESVQWPVETGIGALVNYVMTVPKPVPSSINFGLLPTVSLTKEERRSKNRKKVRKAKVALKAREVFKEFALERGF